MPQSHLNQTDIDPLLEKMGCKAVPQRVRRDAVLDADGLGCLAHDAVELACRDGPPPYQWRAIRSCRLAARWSISNFAGLT